MNKDTFSGRPIISVAIATYNSEKTLFDTLSSLARQIFPRNKLEALVIDGGSVDSTLAVAKKFRCRIIDNPKTELIFAKHLAFLKASGKYLMYLDSDESLENPKSLELKVSAFKKDGRIKAVMPSGYKSPPGCTEINDYINEFGDPFSFFMYRESKSDKFLLKDFSAKYEKLDENENMAIFDFSKTKKLPLIELWAGGSTIDLDYARDKFPKIVDNPNLVAHLFYLFNQKGSLLALTKNDPTIHCSVQNIKQYRRKLISRIKNNVFKTEMGQSGLEGRQRFHRFSFSFKKYLFIFYAFSLILPLMESLGLAISRRKLIYLLHSWLSIFTGLLIVYYAGLKSLGLRMSVKPYGT